MLDADSRSGLMASTPALYENINTHIRTELRRDGVERLIAQYRFSGREPVGDDVIDTMLATPKILERRRRITSATNRIMNLIDIFEDA